MYFFDGGGGGGGWNGETGTVQSPAILLASVINTRVIIVHNVFSVELNQNVISRRAVPNKTKHIAYKVSWIDLFISYRAAW